MAVYFGSYLQIFAVEIDVPKFPGQEYCLKWLTL